MDIYELRKVDHAPSMCVLDTGATQSAGGYEALQKLIYSLHEMDPGVQCRWDRRDCPWFHFGNGQWAQSTGKAYVQTRMGPLSVYELQSENVPILIGADQLEEWGILISYLRNTAVLEALPDKPQVELLKSAGGHRLIDFAEGPLRHQLSAE